MGKKSLKGKKRMDKSTQKGPLIKTVPRGGKVNSQRGELRPGAERVRDRGARPGKRGEFEGRKIVLSRKSHKKGSRVLCYYKIEKKIWREGNGLLVGKDGEPLGGKPRSFWKTVPG